MKEVSKIKKIEDRANKFKQRMHKGHYDRKRHDQVRPDEQKWMHIARNQLGGSFAKIASVFSRDPRTVTKCLQKEQRILADLKSGKTVEQQPKEAIPDPRLMKHLDELAETADILAQHAQRLIRYKDDDDIEAMGDVLGHLSFWRKSNRTIVEEGTDPTGEIEYESRHPIDPYLANWLYIHYDYRFGKLPFEKWNQLSTLNVTGEILDNLKLLAHAGLKPCPNCPACKEIIY